MPNSRKIAEGLSKLVLPQHGIIEKPALSKSRPISDAIPRIAARSSSPSTKTATSAKKPSLIHGVMIACKRGKSVAPVYLPPLPPSAVQIISATLSREVRTILEIFGFAEIGRASCRERVEISVVAGSLKKKKVRKQNE